jgi:hypothetical protein
LLLAAEDREASPIGLVLILFLGVAVVLLIRSMNKHLRRVPAQFPGEPGPGPASAQAAEPPAGAKPVERRADPDGPPARPADPDGS